uniref:Uncharacterized tatC-like protein ymf16 n=1 Tax=Reclinomonas americana TaxID=48483 RepID=YMF16_RECAM|nr:Sec-independent protein translocase component TatC [Reclinomonas americana]O21266.1 RecName: Full=Uncharacterized tatC-like protein ymf16 [Reclinomonas americana]AAD11893.1 Sec-independent protein translocase component TatC [Reclinomonas americana]
MLYNIPILTHLYEIRLRIIYLLYSIFLTCFCSYQYKEEIFYLLFIPLSKNFIYTDLIEAFITYIKLSIIVGIYLSYPIFLYQIWSFLIPGFFLYEKKLFRLLCLTSIFLYFLGSCIGYYLLFPIAFTFFLGFQKLGKDQLFTIELQAKIHEYLILNTKLIFSLSICFQLPVLILFLFKIYPKTYLWLIHKRRFIYLFFFILAAILSPPDILSQFILVIPLILFFEISLFCIKLIQKYNSFMEPIGFEPTASCLQSTRSTI